MNNIQINTNYLEGFVSKKDMDNMFPEVEKAFLLLKEKKVLGNDFLGWQDLPNVHNDEIEKIKKIVLESKKISNVLVVIGIGGSYLGARAIIELLCPELINKDIFFAGYNLSSDNIQNLLNKIKDKDVLVNIISKSGTTLESAIVFRIIKDFLKEKYGEKELKNRIICTTDEKKGALRQMVKIQGYKSFIIPRNVGGRFSVLSSVGLFPLAYVGIDIDNILKGAKDQLLISSKCDYENISCKYAAIRNILYTKDKKIEILSNFDDQLNYLSDWWKQLFAESEGKEGKGIFPSICNFSKDLHSIGQLIQEGERNIFETFLIFEKTINNCFIPFQQDDFDQLNYIAGKSVDFINKQIYKGACLAHFQGGIPNLTIRVKEKSNYCIGQLLYFFELAVAISGYILGVNPFDQPGVEAYKKNMFDLLGRK